MPSLREVNAGVIAGTASRSATGTCDPLQPRCVCGWDQDAPPAFHTFRHTCASLLFEAGRDVKQVSAWLGHTDPAFTLRTYVHLMDNGIGDAAFMDQVFATSVEAGNSVRSAVPLPPQ